MTAFESNTNSADGNATVGAQIGYLQLTVVHEAPTYHLPPGASPEERFTFGLRYLAGGVPSTALAQIEKAMAAGYTNSRVRFYWVLSILSGRTLSQLTDEDEHRLRSALDWPRLRADDEWVEGLRVIERFLTALDTPKDDPQTAIKAFDELPALQRREILRHLELFLKDKVQDAMWKRALEQARADQNRGDRQNRVWMYFQPDPRAPRAATPAPVSTTVRDRALAWAASAVAVTALVLLTVLSGVGWPLLAWFTGVAGAILTARPALEWHYRLIRLRAEERAHEVFIQPQAAPEGGFADDVDRLFRRYIGRYRPPDITKDDWIMQTSGIHRTVRNEIVTSFRDTATRAEEIAWLVRHRVGDVRTRWQNGTLWSYRERLRMPVRERLLVVLGLSVLAGSGVWMLSAALRQEPLRASVTVVIAVIACRVAVTGWLRITAEERRYAADLAESEARLAGDTRAFERWTTKLSRRPSDREMATWLDCDRRILMDRAMQHYNLAPRHVIASAFITGPGRLTQRARVRRGPWRFSQYQVRVFLLTQDGVRQMTANLDFSTGEFQIRNRTNYRYEAVASVHVTEVHRSRPRFRLTLLNGEPIDVEVTGDDLLPPEAQPDSDVAEVVSLDSSGLRNTLHVLEGIAAEGKQWVRLDRQRRGNRVSMLKKTIDSLMH
ncbi:hypothetical protein [Catenuloplanes indicus]|uniref:Flp pilus assembly protein TadB n=1 Tax=Catenuloplanes indicus TaxID=137267 RepID=A0AAE4AYW5_9ACTN|nr:hypothetical protein [Catenuloplanes indicus]MDQ0367096.1 Flp pilus assembly protein TadB [Catenuloplanes indicus]